MLDKFVNLGDSRIIWPKESAMMSLGDKSAVIGEAGKSPILGNTF